MKDKKKIPTFREMYQYISGKGSNASRHQMEKRMQKDPFVSDAMEGLEKVNKNEAMAQVNDLNSIINHKKKSKTPFSPLAIAATVALLMVTTATLLFFKKWQEAQEPTLTQLEKKYAETAIKDIDIERFLNEDLQQEPISTKYELPTSRQGVTVADDLEEVDFEPTDVKDLMALDIEQTKPTAELTPIHSKPLEEPIVVKVTYDGPDLREYLENLAAEFQTKTTQPKVPAVVLQQPGQVLADVAREAEKRSEAQLLKIPNRVRGLITDATTGDVVPFASINIKGTNNGAVANVDGSFEIVLPDSTKTTLVVSSIGYETQEVKIDGREIVNVAVNAESVALQEYIVIGYGTSSDRTRTGSVTQVKPVIIAAFPGKGKDDFDEYVDKVAILDDSFPAHSAIVKVRFTVNSEGRPTRIRIVSSPSKELSERAKQILLDGPDWIPATKDGKFTRERVEYSIVFKKKENK